MNEEYLNIINDIVNNEEFQKLKNVRHHLCTTRYNHSYNVALKTYKMCKKRNLDYISATRAALLHDFFFDDEINNRLKRLVKHYEKAINNASKITELSDKEKQMISSHMFPVGGTIPKSKEALIIDYCDDVVTFKERFNVNKKKAQVALASILVFLFTINK